MPLKSLLLVDDDMDDQDIFRTALSEVAQSVLFTTANNGEEALRKLNGHVYPDVIFLDINMPILNGFDTLVEIKKQERLRHIPVFIYSTSVRQQDIDRARQLGAAKCIKKPSGFMEVCGFISTLLDKDL